MKHFVNGIYSKKLKLLRHRMELTQRDMAAKLNLSQQAYCKLEKGKTNFTTRRIQEICRVCSIQEKDFMLMDEQEIQKAVSVKGSRKESIVDSGIEALNNHYEILFMESELQNIRLQLQLKNYKPYQETSGKDTPLIYVMI